LVPNKGQAKDREKEARLQGLSVELSAVSLAARLAA